MGCCWECAAAIRAETAPEIAAELLEIAIVTEAGGDPSGHVGQAGHAQSLA